MKTNLFSRFRNLFRKADTDYEYEDDYQESYEESCETPYDDADAAEQEPPAAEGEADSGEEPSTMQSGRSLRMPHGAGTPEPEPAATGVHVPLAPILAGMPLELQSRMIHDVGDLSIFLPIDRILPQLATGAVSLSFGELRKAAPRVFNTDRDQDAVPVAVPLSAVLPQISPDMLSRKHGPLQVDIPEDIVSPFADKGRGLAIGAMKLREPNAEPKPQAPLAPAPPAAPAITSIPDPFQRTPVPQSQGSPGATPKTPLPRPTVLPFPAAQRPKAPSAATESVAPETTSTQGLVNRPIGYPSAQKAATPAQPLPGHAVSPSPRIPAAASSGTSPSTAPGGTKIIGRTNAAGAAAAPAAGSQDAPAPVNLQRPPLTLPLSSVANSWPDSLKQEILQLNLAAARLCIPYEIVETGLKRGRLVFAWQQVRSWCKPEVKIAASVHDPLELELPLRVIAPLFVAQKKAEPQKTVKVAVDRDIPNLFFGLPQPDTAGVAVDHSVNRPVDTNYYVWDDRADLVADNARNDAARHARTAGTEFITRYATPNEVVSRAAALDGVEGALIALPDGLMVASQLPPGLNGDTLAAFLPQLFGKVTQCTQELRMGELNNLNFTVGNVPWKIFRVNALYFAAFGVKGEAMPTAKLAALAGELDHKAKA